MFIEAEDLDHLVVILNSVYAASDYQHETNRHGDPIVIEYPPNDGESIEWSVEEQQEGFYLHC